VERNLGLIGLHIRLRVPVSRNPTRQREYEDLFQEGCLGLMRAAVSYDPTRHPAFAAYALPRIRCAIHRALHSRFSTIQVPVRARLRDRDPAAEGSSPPLPLVQEITTRLEQDMTTEHRFDQPGETDTLRHALWSRYERAVRLALDELGRRRWTYRNPCEIMARLARERLLIGVEAHRTPQRQIARDFAISCGRITDYEKKLTQAIAGELERDPQVRALLELAREEPAGMDAPMDRQHRDRLLRAEVLAFRTRFETMEPPARAMAFYALLEQCSEDLPEIAANLYRLAWTAGHGAVRTVA
jgi:RNA polymerase sigma factor (sigma-70 family)